MNQVLTVIMLVFILAGAMFFLLKRPTANWILGSTLAVTAFRDFEIGIIYSRTIFALLILSSLLIYLKGGNTSRHLQIVRRFMSGKFKLFPILLMVIFIKILIDTGYYGLNEVRSTFLKLSVYAVIMPVIIIMLSLVKNPVKECLNDCVTGLCYYSSVLIIVTIISGFPGRQFLAGDLLSIGDIDTINGGRFLYYGAVGYLIAAVLAEDRNWRIFFGALSFAIITLVIFNGTRMFIVGYVIFVSFLSIIFRKSSVAFIIVCLILVSTVALFQVDTFSEISFVTRMGAGEMEQELNYGRGRIWEQAFYLSQTNPLGVGFSNFSNYHYMGTMFTRAHGFFQEIMAEHGFIIFILAVTSFLYLIAGVFLKGNITVFFYEKIFVLLFFTISIPHNFTDTFLNALGYHLFAVVPFLFQKNEIK